MHRTKARTLGFSALLAGGAGYLTGRLLDGYGITVPGAPWIVDASILALAAFVVREGLLVRSYLRGKRPSLAGLRAARTVALAKAAALTGALLAGWYAGHIWALGGDLAVEPVRARAVGTAVALLCAVVLGVCGWLAERWCVLPPADGGDSDGSGARSPA